MELGFCIQQPRLERTGQSSKHVIDPKLCEISATSRLNDHMHTMAHRRYRPKRYDYATAPVVCDIAQYDFAFKAVQRAGILVGVYLFVQFSTLEKSSPVHEERECQMAELDR
jgi:hypothetical protein